MKKKRGGPSRDVSRVAGKRAGTLRKAIKMGGLSIIGLLLLVTIGEMSLRLAYGDKFGIRPLFYIADPVIGWKPAANLDHTFYGADFETKIATDEDGYRLGAGGEVDFGKELILFDGDSYVFGWGVSTEETVASYVDECVADASGGNTRVVNLGVGSYGTLQYYERLLAFLAKHGDARLAAVFIFHSPNDPVDNVNSIGYHLGVWKAFDKRAKPRSSFHLLNYATYLLEMAGDRTDVPAEVGENDDEIHPYLEDMLHPYLQDLLFGYRYELPRTLPLEIAVDGGGLIDLRDLSEKDYSAKATFKRESYTQIQRDLILLGVNFIHRLLAGRNTKIFHINVPTSPDWDVDEITALIDQADPSSENEIIVLGRYPDDISDYTNDVLNSYTAGHYSAEFNRYWADKLVAVLREHDVVTQKNPQDALRADH